MLADIADGDPSLNPVRPSAVRDVVRDVVRDELPAPDPAVVESARHRLAAQLAPAAGRYPGELPAHLIEDLQAVKSVLDAACDGADLPADALDVGAGLVVLGNLRLHLDQLEADLLDGAQRVGLGWDVIAAILGIPAREAQDRHLALRARPDPR
jgi:hypothetical protein